MTFSREHLSGKKPDQPRSHGLDGVARVESARAQPGRSKPENRSPLHLLLSQNPCDVARHEDERGNASAPLNAGVKPEPVKTPKPGWRESFPFPMLAVATVTSTLASPTNGVATGLPALPPGEEIYDLNPARMIPLPWLSLALQLLVVLVALWVLWRLSLYLLNQGLHEEPEPPPPPPDPLEEALEALQRLKTHLTAGGVNEKDLCERLAGILKVFVHRRVQAGFGGGSTTDELIAALRGQQIETALIQDVEQVQTLGDAVKFARGSLGALTPAEMVAGYETLIKRPEWNR